MKKLLTLITLMSLSSAYAVDVDLTKSKLNWKGTKVTGKHIGTINLQSAKVKDEKGNLKSGEFVVKMESVSVSDLNGKWKEKFLTHIKSADFFEVKKYPTAKLVLKELKGTKAKGDLTIKGITHPVMFKMLKKGKEYTGKLKFDRTKFKMVYGSGDFFKGLGDKMIHNEINLDFKIVLK